MYLREKQIGYCKGCFACHELGHCVLRDDAAAIIAKMHDADVLVFATPVYYYCVSGQLKTLLDRANPLYDSDYAFTKAYLLATAAEDAPETFDGTEKAVQGWVDCFPRCTLAGTVFAGGVNSVGEIAGHPALEQAYQMGVLEWVDDAGNVLPGSTRVKANTAYKWRFTPADGNYTTLSGEIELYYKPNGGNQCGTDRTIRASAGANGTISPAGWTSVGEGGEQTFTITPDAGYAVAKVLVDGRSVGAVTSYTFRNVTQDHTIEAVFMKANGNPQTGVTVTRSTTGCGR